MNSMSQDSNDLEIVSLRQLGDIIFPSDEPGTARDKRVGRLRDVGLRLWKNGQGKTAPLVTNLGEVKRWQMSKLTAEDAARRVS